ncbi:MAG: hypothetical protein J6C03_02865 [Clostridia bacterium]|nr:hypothetical protein [Clostridia bacterium]
MMNVRFLRVISLALAAFTVCAAVPFSTAAAEKDIYIPSLEVEQIETLNVKNGVPENITVYNSGEDEELPERYSSVEKGFVTKPKDQGQFGTCWTFAAASMAESSILSSGGTYSGKQADVDKIDFSEAQIAYFTYADAYDPLGNLNGDGTYFLGSDLLFCGGNHYFTTLSFASWKGLCKDSTMPYSKLVEDPAKEYDEKLSYRASVRLENAIWINMADRAAVKKMIMENGAVLSDYCHEDMFFNEETASYYCDIRYATNHAITLVGWDDDYSRENFLGNPAGDGAWLVKNSWGEEWGDNGYFWLSYYDVTSMNNAVTCMQFADELKYDNSYQYDGSCAMSYVPLDSGMLMANSFTTSAYEQEKLEAVSFAVMTDNVDYKIRVIKNNSDFVMVDGESVLENVIEGHVDHAGYYTIPVEEDVVLEKGEEYLVCITFSSDTEPYICVLVDGSDIDVEGGISFVNNMENDRSYYGIETPLSPSGVYLENLTEANGVTARIKAFTSNVGEEDIVEDEDIEDEGGEGSGEGEGSGSGNDDDDDIFDWFHTIINGIDTEHKAGETIELFADFFYDEDGYAHRFIKWICDSGSVDINEESAEISFVMPEGNVELHAEYVIVGDVNFDEKINALDVIEMRKDLKFDISGEVDVAADINDDGKNNALDFIAMKKYIGNKYEIIK